jgi:hypothetical protein
MWCVLCLPCVEEEGSLLIKSSTAFIAADFRVDVDGTMKVRVLRLVVLISRVLIRGVDCPKGGDI